MLDYHRYQGEVVKRDQSNFLNVNIKKWCAICGAHKPQLGGTTQFVMGGRNWVCANCKKVKK